MAKRFQPMKDFARAKKQKLDVSIIPARNENAYNSYGNVNKPAPATSKPQASPALSNAIDFWDDDDDDVILLATQQAEAAVERHQINAASEMTFSEFAPQLHGQTSTQQVFLAPAPKPAQNNGNILFDDDDDDFDIVAVTEVEKKFACNMQATGLTKTQSLPQAGSLDVQVVTQTQTATATSGFSQAAAARRQLAQERQMKFLMERVELLKKENGKLQKDLGESKERIESKDGEASLLRDELRHLRHQLQTIKMEKMKITENTKMECNNRMAEVIKQVTAKETELQLKSVEFSKLKMRHSIETRHFEMSMCLDDSIAVETGGDARRNLLRLHNFNIDTTINKKTNHTGNASVYEYTKNEAKSSKQRTLFELELEQLLLCYAQLQAQPHFVERTSERIIASVCKVFPEFWSYAHSLDFPHNCVLYPYHSYTLDLDDSAVQRQALTQPSVLYKQEHAVCLRRYLATLTLICQQEHHIASALLQYKHGEYWLLQIANDAIAKLGYSNEVCEHFGVLEASAALLRSLLNHTQSSMHTAQCELLFDLLKQLAFTRPSPWIFRELSACFLACTRQPQLMVQMCVNSPKECYISDRVRSTYRFGPDSCLLQVYAGLLELAFFSEMPLRREHFELLLSICGHHVRFVYQCFINPPDFILEMLPSLADDDDDSSEEALSNGHANQCATTLSMGSSVIATIGSSTNVSSIPSEVSVSNTNSCTSLPLQPQTSQITQGRTCECYVKLCLSVVTLVFQMLHQWMLHDRKIHTSQVGEISQVAVHLLTLIFREYYLTSLFRDSEETTKHYLSLICNWWQEHAKLLCFQEIHVRFLQNLQDSHFMLKPVHQESNPSNPTNDLLEWKRIVKNADVNVQNYVSPSDPFNCQPLDAVNTRKFFDGIGQTPYDFE